MILIVGTVAAVGLWMLRIEAPVEYEEPFVVEYSDELNQGKWQTIRSFPHEQEKGSIDLTYRTFHDYFRISYDGRKPVQLNATITADMARDFELQDIGFAIFEGIARPDEVTWHNNTPSYHGNQVEINWGFYTQEIDLDSNETEEFTVINVLSNDAPLSTGEDDLSITWDFYRSDPGLEHFVDELPPTDGDVYNATPILIVASVMITSVISYFLFGSKGGD
ncbi:MAG: hypothetical protein ACQESD_01230 [Thermoplasmatota archaeon]